MDEQGMQRAREAKTRIKEIEPRGAMHRLATGDDVIFLDVREPHEWNLFHIPGALHVPLGEVENRVQEVVPRDRDVIVYCGGGNRSAIAADTMQELGYARVASMSEGVRGWVNAGGAVEE